MPRSPIGRTARTKHSVSLDADLVQFALKDHPSLSAALNFALRELRDGGEILRLLRELDVEQLEHIYNLNPGDEAPLDLAVYAYRGATP